MTGASTAVAVLTSSAVSLLPYLSPLKMDDESLKWNTDCVYFLASPLTCKKGAECEYRHSDIARLNPRDCWYWLAGNCLNPTRGFRHPPLDGLAGKTSESAHGLAPVSVSKTGVPCYFYVNGHCSKGDRCSFLHGNDGGIGSGRSTRMASANIESIPSDTKVVSGNDKDYASDKNLDSSKNSRRETTHVMLQPKEEIWQPFQETIVQQSICTPTPVSQLKEVAVTRSEPLLAEEEYPEDDDGLGEQVVDHIEPEERWESSPGFDVLVDDDMENLGYEDNPEYYLTIERKRRDLNSHYLGHDFEGPMEYESKYHDEDDSYDRVENGITCVNDRDSHRVDFMESRKRKLIRMESTLNDRIFVDLRDHLRRRRLANDSLFTGLSRRRHESSYQTSEFLEEPRRDGISHQLGGRLSSTEENGNHPYFTNIKESAGLYNQYNSRKHPREKRHGRRQFLSEVSRKTDSRDRTFAPEASTFNGPKSRTQIREEKRRKEKSQRKWGLSRRKSFKQIDHNRLRCPRGEQGVNSAAKEE